MLGDVLLAGAASRDAPAPGKVALEWQKIAPTTSWVLKPSPQKGVTASNMYIRADQAVNRMLLTEEGQRLVSDLTRVLSSGDAPARKIALTISEPEDWTDPDDPSGNLSKHSEDGAAGFFAELPDDQNGYGVFARWEKDIARRFPPEFGLRQGASLLAHTLFHECLHIWFVNTFSGHGSGHSTDDPDNARVNKQFQDRIDNIERQLKAIENR